MGETRTAHPDKRGSGKFAGLVPHYLLIVAMFAYFFVSFRVISIFTDPVHQWLAVAYLYDLTVLILVLTVRPLRRCLHDSWKPLRAPFEGLPMEVIRIGLFVALAVIFLTVLHFVVMVPLSNLLPDIRLRSNPRVEPVALAWFDLTLGMALLVVVEELAFRGVLRHIIERYTKSRIILIFLSAVLFGLAHWFRGPDFVLSAFFLGIVLMYLYVKTGSFLPSILTHSGNNFIALYPWYFG